MIFQIVAGIIYAAAVAMACYSVLQEDMFIDKPGWRLHANKTKNNIKVATVFFAAFGWMLIAGTAVNFLLWPLREDWRMNASAFAGFLGGLFMIIQIDKRAKKLYRLFLIDRQKDETLGGVG